MFLMLVYEINSFTTRCRGVLLFHYVITASCLKDSSLLAFAFVTVIHWGFQMLLIECLYNTLSYLCVFVFLSLRMFVLICICVSLCLIPADLSACCVCTYECVWVRVCVCLFPGELGFLCSVISAELAEAGRKLHSPPPARKDLLQSRASFAKWN